MLIRFGGDEFLLILHGAGRLSENRAGKGARRRAKRRHSGFPHLHLSMSIGGVAQMTGNRWKPPSGARIN
ncbi:MAG: hypothetical protein ACLUI3_10585 [Christensenellales bacterium]